MMRDTQTYTFEQDIDLPDEQALCAWSHAIGHCLGASDLIFQNLQVETANTAHDKNITFTKTVAQLKNKADWQWFEQNVYDYQAIAWSLHPLTSRDKTTQSMIYTPSEQNFEWHFPVWSDDDDAMFQATPWLTALAQTFSYPAKKLRQQMAKHITAGAPGVLKLSKNLLGRTIPGFFSCIQSRLGRSQVWQSFVWHVPFSYGQAMFAFWAMHTPFEGYAWELYTDRHHLASLPNMVRHGSIETLSEAEFTHMDPSMLACATGTIELSGDDVEGTISFWRNDSGYEVRCMVDMASDKAELLLPKLEQYCSLLS